jgi:hypothetical protein
MILPLGHLLFIAATLCTSVHAFPTTISNCEAGLEAINGEPHVPAPTIITGSLDIGGFSVKLGTTTLSTTTTSTFAVGVNTTLTITGTKAFKGFFMRLGEVGGVQTDTALSGTGNVKVPKVCITAGVGGVCHTSSSEKTSVTAVLRLDAAAASMPLDVTIVVVADYDVSEYYYTEYKISAVSASTPTLNPTASPTVAITAKPTMSPTASPTKVPTKISTKIPTNVPIKIPTKVPTKTPTNIPTKVPTKTPTKIPTRKPA